MQGDLEEFFNETVEESGVFKARLYYFWNVIRCFQPYAWKVPQSQNSTIVMFRNYFKTSYRSMMRNPMNSFINLFGLSVAIGVCVLGYSFIKYTFKIDQFHENKDQVYLTTFFADREGVQTENGTTPIPLGELLRNDFAQITSVCRIEKRNAVVKYDSRHVFHEGISYVDPDYLDMLSFPLKWGKKNSLKDINSIVLSEDMAIKYFGDEYPIGENLKVIFDQDKSKVFEVVGVAAEFPGARSFDFDFLINFENFVTTQDEDIHDWSSYIDATLIKVKSNSDLQLIKDRMEKYTSAQNENDPDQKISSFSFESIATLYENSPRIRNDISGDGFMTLYNSSISFVIIGFFVLVLAASNYINIAIVSAVKRLKEIGLRKVVGANRGMVVVQFLTENVLMMSIALLVGVLLGSTVFVPWLENRMRFDMDFVLFDQTLWIFLPAILLFTAFVSGLFPAFYISKFQVASIFRKSFKIGKKNLLTRIFLGFQLLLACVIISIAVMFTQNTRYQLERSWGYEKDEVLYVNVPTKSAFDQLHAVISQNPNVVSISGSGHHLGRSSSVAIVDFTERQYEVRQMDVDHNYFQTMGKELLQGRHFEDKESDMKSVIINETFVSNLATNDVIGLTFKIGDSTLRIIGVAKDAHSNTFYTKIKPTIFRLAEPETYKFLSVKVHKGSDSQTYDKLKSEWAVLFPEIPFDGGYQEDVWGNFEADMKDGDRFWSALAIVVVSIAALGLYGLVTLNVSGRSKEFSIRKVLGAELKNIFSNITRQYSLVFATVLILAAPVSYYLVDLIFETFFVYYRPLDYTFFIFSGGIMILVMIAVVATQMKRLSKSNPVEGLNIE